MAAGPTGRPVAAGCHRDQTDDSDSDVCLTHVWGDSMSTSGCRCHWQWLIMTCYW